MKEAAPYLEASMKMQTYRLAVLKRPGVASTAISTTYSDVKRL